MSPTRKKNTVNEEGVIEVKKLLEALLSVKPAILQNQHFIPVLSFFCFSGGYVFAYNDTLAIASKYGSNMLDGLALPDYFYDMLKASNVKSIKIQEVVDNVLKIRLGKALVKFPFLESNSFLFVPPPLEDYVPTYTLRVDPGFIDGVKDCLLNVIDDPTVPNQKGITLEVGWKGPDRRKAQLYSTDNVTVTRCVTESIVKNKKGDDSEGSRVSCIIPKNFCVELVLLFKKVLEGNSLRLNINDSFCWVTYKGVRTIFTKLVPLDGSIDFEAQVFVPFLKEGKVSYFNKEAVAKIQKAASRIKALQKYLVEGEQILDMLVREGTVTVQSNQYKDKGNAHYKERILLKKDIVSCSLSVSVLKLERACQLCDSLGVCIVEGITVVIGKKEGHLHHVVSTAASQSERKQ